MKRNIWVLAPLFLVSTAWGEVCYRPSAQDLHWMSDVLDVVENVAITNSPDCYDQLTSTDRTFLKKLQAHLLKVCPDLSQGCAQEMEKVWDSEFTRYGEQAGGPALERVSVAIHAALKEVQVQSSLKALSEPSIRPQFEKFGESLARFNAALGLAVYQDVQPKNPDSTLDQLSVRTRRYLGMAGDLIGHRINRNSSPGSNRIVALEAAVKDLVAEKKTLADAIQSSKLSPRKKQALLEELNGVIDELRAKVRNAPKEFLETNQAIQVGAGAVGAAGLLVASFGTVSPLVAGGSTAVFKMGATSFLFSAGSAGTTGLSDVAKMALAARAESRAKETRYFCELAREASTGGALMVRNMAQAANKGAIAGAVLSAQISIASEALKMAVSPQHAQFLLSLNGATQTANSMQEVVASELAQHRELKGKERELQALERKVAEGSASLGDYIEARRRFEHQRAAQVSRAVSDSVSLTRQVMSLDQSLDNVIDVINP